MVCENCGYQLKNGAERCKFCGAVVKKGYVDSESEYDKIKPKKSLGWLIYVIVALVIALAVFLATWFFGGSDSDSEKSEKNKTSYSRNNGFNPYTNNNGSKKGNKSAGEGDSGTGSDADFDEDDDIDAAEDEPGDENKGGIIVGVEPDEPEPPSNQEPPVISEPATPVNVSNVRCGALDGRPIQWCIHMNVDNTSKIKNVSCSWSGNITSVSGNPNTAGWDSAVNGSTLMWIHDGILTVMLPNNPSIAGGQYININEKRISFNLSWLGDYSEGYGSTIPKIYGWDMTNVSIS